MDIDIYSQYFTTTDTDFHKHLFDMREFNKNLVTYKMVSKKINRYSMPITTTVVDKLLYIIEEFNPINPQSSNIIRYPISVLQDCLHYLKTKNIEYSETHHTHIQGDDIKFIFNPNKVPKEYQNKYVDIIYKTKYNNVLVDLQTGKGKSSCVNTPIKIKRGWIRLGDVRRGDKVIGKDGCETTVTGVYPQGIMQLYKMTFSDGRHIDICLDHLWSIYLDNNDMSEVLNTKEIINYLRNKVNCYIDLPTPSNFDPMEYIVHPYTLGVLLSTVDINMSLILKKLSINIDNTLDKYIPEEYLEGSLEQRYDLLRGLMDTDGDVSKDGIPSYNTASKKLAEDVQLLVRSLGGMCSSYAYYPHNDEKKKGRLSYRLNIRMKNPMDIVTSPKRKERLKELNQYSHNLKLRIVSIEESIKNEAVCISVDNKDKLFVAKDYIVTHNTLISLIALSKIGKKFGVLILPRYIGKWIDDITLDTDIRRDELLVVQGLSKLVEIMSNPMLLDKYKCYIISVSTVTMFITHYLQHDVEKTLGFSPSDVARIFKIDSILNDEAHQNFYGILKFMMFCNHRLTLGLTATLLHNDKYITKMYDVGFPESHRISNIIPYDKYIIVFLVRYSFRNKKMIRFKNQFGYDRYKFEKSILRYHQVKINYFKMITSLLNTMYIKRYRKDKKDKCIIYMGSVEMCIEYNEYISNIYKDFKTSKYTEEESYDIIEKTDIIISTIPSAGAALDVSNLISVIMTVNTDSMSDNIQTLGRLRKLDDIEVWYANIWSMDIKQHARYNANMRKLFIQRSKDIRSINYRHKI